MIKFHDIYSKNQFFLKKKRFSSQKKLIFCSIIPFCIHSYVSYHILWLQLDTLVGFPKKSQKSWFFQFFANLDIWSNFMIYAPKISFFWKKSIFLQKKVAQGPQNTFVCSQFNFGRYILNRNKCAAIFVDLCCFKICIFILE